MEINIKALIVDDDLIARKILSDCIEMLFPEIKLEMACYAIEGLKKIKSYNPDLVFLDIEMPYGNGFDMLESLSEKKFEVIIVSGHTSFKSQLKECNAIGYLTKPIEDRKLCTCIKKAIQIIKKKRLIENSNISINEIKPELIIRVLADRSYCNIFLATGELITLSKSLSKLQDYLPNNVFFRSHRSHLINLSYITKYEFGRNAYIEMTCGTKVPLSRDKTVEFESKISN